MGAWGAGLLDNDDAADVQGTFDDVLADGGSVEHAITTVMEEYEDALEDEDSRADIVLALAWLASERGAVPEWLAAETREIVTGEVALERWQRSPEYEERQAVEARLLAVLDGSAP